MKSKIEKNMEKSVRFYVYKAFKIVFFIILGLLESGRYTTSI